jgi:cytochrome c oxidase assembly protein subunit 11
MQNRFIKSLIYVLLGITLCIFLLTQPFNVYCRLTKKCYPITLSSFSIIKKGQKEITINFESKVDNEIKNIVEFYPNKKSLTKFSNEYITNSYIVKNLGEEEINIRAKYKATPLEADQYLNRIECLCFQSEYLEAGEEIKMPIRFQIKDEIDDSTINDINISYEIEIL